MPDIVPSEELRDFMLRFYRVWAAEDLEAYRELFISGAKLLCIGSDGEEWWTAGTGPEVLLRQAHELGGVQFITKGPTAYRIGDSGWIADQPIVKLKSGEEIQMRMSCVMVIDRGHWRIAHWHGSVPQTNEDAFGRELKTNIEGVERSVLAERPDVRAASAPDGTVTILFTDIESSTVLMQRLGDSDFVHLLAWHDGIIRTTAEEHHGFVVKSQGDGFMLAFSSAAFALRASLIMRERIGAGFNGLPVRIRAGLHAGEAIKREDDFYGHTVVIAARISALALGDEILASDVVHSLARSLGTFDFGEERSIALKGLDGEYSVYPVLG